MPNGLTRQSRATLEYRLGFGFGLVGAVHMTVTTLTTVGFGEIHPLGTGGRVFTLSLIVVGMGAMFTPLAVLTPGGQRSARAVADEQGDAATPRPS